MNKKKKSLVTFFFFSWLLLLNAFFFIEPAQARPFRGRLIRRRQRHFKRRKVCQPSRTEASPKSRPSKVKPATPKDVSGVGSNSQKGLTDDERMARQRRHKNYDQWFPQWSRQREKLDSKEAAKVALVKAENLSNEGRQAYSATQKEDVDHYKKKQGVTAIDLIDPLTGAQMKIRRSKEDGANVYNVKDEATGFLLHELESEARSIIALSSSGIKVKVGYGDADNPQWASSGYYSTSLKELNLFAGFNRGDDHFIRAIGPATKSPSDLGQTVFDPIRWRTKDLTTFAQAKDSYSGNFLRPELAVLMKSDSLSESAKFKIGKAMIEDMPYGRIISTSKQLEKIIKADVLEDGFEREYAVYGGRNALGRSIYFGIELEGRPFKPVGEPLGELTTASNLGLAGGAAGIISKLASEPGWVKLYSKDNLNNFKLNDFPGSQATKILGLYKNKGRSFKLDGVSPYYETPGGYILLRVMVKEGMTGPWYKQAFRFNKHKIDISNLETLIGK